MSTPPKRIKNSIKKESIPAKDFLYYSIPYACEDCSHFSHTNQVCSLGNQTLAHRREQQLKNYLLSGKMAFCRLLEID